MSTHSSTLTSPFSPGSIRYTSFESEKLNAGRPQACLMGDWLFMQLALSDLLADVEPPQRAVGATKMLKVEQAYRQIYPDEGEGKYRGVILETSALEARLGDNEKDLDKFLKPEYAQDKLLFQADADRYFANREKYLEATSKTIPFVRRSGQAAQLNRFVLHTGLRGVSSWEGLGRRSWHSCQQTIDINQPTPTFAIEFNDLLLIADTHPQIQSVPEAMEERYRIRFDALFEHAKSRVRPHVAVQLNIGEHYFALYAITREKEVKDAGIVLKLGNKATQRISEQLDNLVARHVKLLNNVSPQARQSPSVPGEGELTARGPLVIPAASTSTRIGWCRQTVINQENLVVPPVDVKGKPKIYRLVHPVAPAVNISLPEQTQYVYYPDTCVAFYIDSLLPALQRIIGNVSVVMVPGVIGEIANQASYVRQRVADAKATLSKVDRWDEPVSLLRNTSIYKYSNIGKELVPVINFIAHEMALDMQARVAAGAARGVRVIPTVLTVDAGINLLVQSMHPLPADLRLPLLTQLPTAPLCHISQDIRKGKAQTVLKDIFWDIIYDGLDDSIKPSN